MTANGSTTHDHNKVIIKLYLNGNRMEILKIEKKSVELINLER